MATMKQYLKQPLTSLLFLIVAVIFLNNTAQAQGVSAQIKLDTTNKNVPIVLSLESNDRNDIVAVRITMLSGKFSAYRAGNDSFPVLPISNRVLEIRNGLLDSMPSFKTGKNTIVLKFLTDSSELKPKFLIEFFNKTFQSVFEQTLSITIPLKNTSPDLCAQNFLSLSTGINQATSASYSPGAIDPYWEIWEAPSGSTITTFPAPAYASNYGSNGIGLMAGNGYLSDLGTTGTYIFRHTFCASSKSDAVLTLYGEAYDSIGIYFNGSFIGTTSFAPPNSLNVPAAFDQNFAFTKNVPIQSGTNTIEIHLFIQDANYFQFFGGITAAANVNSLGLTSDACCSPKGQIRGRKWWDLNCNGVHNFGEPGVPGWTITLTQPSGATQTYTTLANGSYVFPNLPSGTYTLTESPQNGWIMGATTSYTVTLGTNQVITRNFLNCKKPDCANLFTEELGDQECCKYSFDLSNGIGKLSKIEYSLTGGTVSFVETEPCFASSSIPTNLTNTIGGALNYNPSCNSPLKVTIAANSMTKTGLICVHFKFTYQLGASFFTCDTNVCFQCKPMPTECGSALSVEPNAFLSTVADFRTFRIDNTKLPHSDISSIDIKFNNEPTPHHFGHSSIVIDPLNPNTIRSWTYNNSGGPGNAYSQIRFGCNGVAGIHGSAATNLVLFALGVDNTINYTGVVHLKVGYCDGDTCEFDYNWNPPIIRSMSGSIENLAVPAKTRILGIKVTPPDSSTSFSITLKDSAAVIISVTAPSTETGNLAGLNVNSVGNIAQYGKKYALESGKQLSAGNIFVVYTSPDSIQTVIVRYFDSRGREIGQGEKRVSGTKLSVIPIPGVAPGDNGISINSVVPNPSSGLITVNYTLSEADDARLELYNMLGQSVAILADGFQTQGMHQMNYNAFGLAEGTYYLRLSTRFGTVTAVVKVIH